MDSQPGTIWGREPAMVLALVQAVIALVVAFSSGGGDDGDAADGSVRSVGPVVVNDPPLPALGDEPDAALGVVAPLVEARTPADGAVSFGGPDAEGRPTLVVFLAHWCPHCQAEVPRLTAWAEAGNAPDDVDIVAVSTNVSRVRDNFPPSDWLDDEGWPFPTMKDDAASSAHLALC